MFRAELGTDHKKMTDNGSCLNFWTDDLTLWAPVHNFLPMNIYTVSVPATEFLTYDSTMLVFAITVEGGPRK
jgi:hypothetical protein